MNEVRVFTEGHAVPRDGVTARSVKNRACKILDVLDLDRSSLSIILTGDESIRSINREYRGIDLPTDVLSFAERECPFPEPEKKMEMLGEIYISMDRASAQALEYGVSMQEETLRLLVHGILHLLGYDHERSAGDARVMEAREGEILSSVTGAR